jgi:hypothetical protein
MKRTYVLIDGKFVERKKDSKGSSYYIVPDIQPYKSMIDGKMITSRSEHRRHLKANNCIEVGNDDPAKHIAKPKVDESRFERLKYEVNNRLTNAQADAIIRKLREQANFTNPHRRG